MNIRTANLSDILKLNTSSMAEGSYGKQEVSGQTVGYLSGACYTEGIRTRYDFSNYTKQGWEQNSTIENASAGTEDSAAQEIQAGIQEYISRVTPDAYEKFSDMGMIPDQESPEEFVTVAERIEIQLAATCEDYIPTGNIDIDDIQAMYGTSGRAYEISNALKQRGLNVTSEAVNEMEQSLQMAEELQEITPEMSQYLLKNQLPLTLENVYKAQYSVTDSGAAYQNVEISEEDWAALESSITQQMEHLGITVTQETLADGKWLVEHELPVTAENLKKLENIRQLNDLGAGEGLAGVSGDQWLYGLAEEAVKVFEQATAEDVENVVYQDKEVTLLNMKKVQEETTRIGQELKVEVYEKKVKTETFYLEEIQLSMSVSGFALLIKNGMDIQIASLKDIAEGLEQQKSQYTQALFYSCERELGISESIYTQENLVLYESSMQHFQAMTAIPVNVLGTVAEGNLPFQVEDMEEAGRLLQKRMEAAGEAYETMGTRPRKDLGDSINKAFQGIDEILEQMDLALTEENKRAVRILAYNEMELTKENITNVKSLDMEVTRLVENMTPKTAIYLIANGMNPLKTDIRKLNDELETINEQIEADTGEHFSEFLWKLDKTNGISQDDRKAFISIYKTLNRIQKHDRGALGEFIEQQEGEISLQSLLAAAESFGKHIDTAIDDSSELRYAKNLIRESLEHMSPQAMAELNLQDIGLEAFAESMLAYQEENAKQEQAMMQEYYEARILEDAKARHISESTLNELLGNRITPSISNLISASAIMSDYGKGFLRMLGWRDEKDLSEDNLQEGDSSELLEQNSEIMALGEELLESMEQEDEFVAAYEDLKENMQQELERQQMLWGEAGTNAIESFSELWNQNWAISYVKQAEQEGSYYIPIALGEEMTTIHLTIQKGETVRGKVDISFETEQFGVVEATLRVTVTEVTMYVNADSEKLEDILRRLEKEQGWIRGAGEDMRELSSEEVPATGELYRVAKIFIQSLR